MRHIHNITFVCSPTDLELMSELLKKEVIPALRKGAEDVRMARVKPLPGADEAESISVQFVLPDEQKQSEWEQSCMLPVLENIGNRYGQRILFFNTLLELMDHEC